ncbi:hypothetical protein HNI00_20580 [Thermoleptolyngbya oregonensis NK1-22]|uniref:Uncharacterized protein n=1 Tax=Thermoleptolyngbya oregonensis NK1-22 TaxID=2547457 RepID=A0AA96YEA6_9CYAN|nr:hypothetical protein [Thermoleptolyngbya oregonensis]WOB45260.1 hypothetical protein HNI00_20580 [Thermoleptolyngbya oregonensis NK1-22]
MNPFGQSLLDSLGDRLLESLSTPLQTWLAAHPIAQWLVMHPLWALGMIVGAIALLVGLFGAIGRLTENLWLRLFQVPLWLFASIFGGGFQLAKRLSQSSTRHPHKTDSDNPTQRLDQILARLTELRREEEQLLVELKTLVAEAGSEANHV